MPAVGQTERWKGNCRVGYYMRYIVSDERPVGLEHIRTALAETATGYAIDGEGAEATATYGEKPIGHVTLNVPGDGSFEEERDELIEFMDEGADGPSKDLVASTLRNAKAIVAVQVLFGDGDTDQTLDRLGPLWSWLLANRRGLIQADGEGYYDGQELILALE